MRKPFLMYPPWKHLPSVLQKHVVGNKQRCPHSEARAWSLVTHLSIHCLALSLSNRAKQPSRRAGCGLWRGCLCHRIPPRSIGQGKITRNPPWGWFSSFSMWIKSGSHEATRLWSTEIPQWATRVYSGGVVVTAMSIKDTISLYKPCHPGETASHEKLMKR